MRFIKTIFPYQCEEDEAAAAEVEAITAITAACWAISNDSAPLATEAFATVVSSA